MMFSPSSFISEISHCQKENICQYMKLGRQSRFWENTSCLHTVLVLGGLQLIFFIAASMRLCFGFLLKTVLIVQGCFRYCWAVLTQSQGFFWSSHNPTSE